MPASGIVYQHCAEASRDGHNRRDNTAVSSKAFTILYVRQCELANSNSNGIVQCASCKHCENADEYQAPYFVSAAAASAAAGGGGSGSNANTVSGASKFNAEFIKYAHAE